MPFSDKGTFQVLGEQCATCIFRPGNPMHLNPGRVADMVRQCRQDQTFIPCHETMTYYGPEYDDETGDELPFRATGPVCRGFYDAHGEVSQMVRIAERIGVLEFVPLADALAAERERERERERDEGEARV